MERVKPITNEIYHILNRGVDKRTVFLDDSDYLRMIHDLFEFNDSAPAMNLCYHFAQNERNKEVGLLVDKRQPRNLLVEILAFSLMPNHFHLMVKQKVDKGVSEFMRKIGTGYTNYFNQKNERTGALFQGKYKIIHINEESHFIHLPYYIHSNPLDLKFPEWRRGEIKGYKKAMDFLEKYRWSSFPDYIGKKNFPSVTQREFLNEYFDGPENYKKETENWLRNLDLENINEAILES